MKLRWILPLLLCPNLLFAQKGSVCSLLAHSEIERVQKDSVLGTKTSEVKVGGLRLQRCYYELANADKSVSLELTRKDSTGSGPKPRERWRALFHETHSEGQREEEGEEKAPPLSVSGVGEEAFWMGRGGLGALYVLKKDSYLRVSVGGPEDRDAKIRKAKTLARKALKRL